MKKFFVSSAVIITFIAYSIHQRAVGEQSIPVIIPKTISNVPSDSPQNTPSSTPFPTLVPTSQKVMPGNTPTSIPRDTPIPTSKPNSPYKDGTYVGDSADAFYGNIQVQATIANGRITNIQFLKYPNDRERSIAINSQADPMLAQEAIQAQSAQVDIISGATDSSNAFVQSMQSALDKAKN